MLRPKGASGRDLSDNAAVAPRRSAVGMLRKKDPTLGSIVSPAVFIQTTALVAAETAWNYLAHELGHVLGLLHTFEGLDLDKLVRPPPCAQCVATAANGWTAGDRSLVDRITNMSR